LAFFAALLFLFFVFVFLLLFFIFLFFASANPESFTVSGGFHHSAVFTQACHD